MSNCRIYTHRFVGTLFYFAHLFLGGGGTVAIQGEVIVKAGDGCRRFYVVLGAPRELLGVGEVPAVSREASALNTDCRLLAGQFFGEKGLLRQTEVCAVLELSGLGGRGGGLGPICRRAVDLLDATLYWSFCLITLGRKISLAMAYTCACILGLIPIFNRGLV